MNFVYAHLHRPRLTSRCRPPLQATQINRAYGACSQAQPPRHLSRRRTLTGPSDSIFETIAERRLAGQLRQFLDLDATIRAAHPEHFHPHRRAEFHARQITHLTLAHIVSSLQLASASRAHQYPIPASPPYPQFERLGPFIDLVLVYAVARPSQQFRQLAISQTASVPKSCRLRNPPLLGVRRIPVQSDNFDRNRPPNPQLGIGGQACSRPQSFEALSLPVSWPLARTPRHAAIKFNPKRH